MFRYNKILNGSKEIWKNNNTRFKKKKKPVTVERGVTEKKSRLSGVVI